MIEYIKEHEEINNVLISGGDSFLNSNVKIEKYLKNLCNIEHLDLIRFGTRVPVVYPERITRNDDLKNILKTYCKKKQIYVVTQFNHPKEVTKEAIGAINYLRESGVVVKNQTVLSYYVFQWRHVTGVKNQFQVPLKEGYDIVERAKNLQNGQGKYFKYCLSSTSGKIEIVGKTDDGKMVFKYHRAKYEKDRGRIFIEDIDDDQTWIY